MKTYGDYSDADLNDWQMLPLISNVLTSSAFGAWLMRRDERRGEREKSVISKIRAEISDFEEEVFHRPNTDYSDYAAIRHCLEIIDKYKESEK